MKIRVNTIGMSKALEQLLRQQERMEELLSCYELFCLRLRSQLKDEKQVVRANEQCQQMRRETEYHRQLCIALERSIRQYEQMERNALQWQEEGWSVPKRAKLQCCNSKEERELLQQWNAI